MIGMPGFTDFEFDLPSALREQLVRLLDGMGTVPLTTAVTAQIPEAQGVYQLFHEGRLVYIGKTDAEAGLRTRLTRHARKILQRPSLTGDVTFKSVRIMVFSAMDLETQLIKHYERLGGSVAWNGSGFGSNDPGRKREMTNRDPDGFDEQHPIDINSPGQWLAPGTKVLAKALAELKSALPFTLRYETLRSKKGHAQRGQPHPDLLAVSVVVPPPPHSVRELMQTFVAVLGREWQATVFASHVILYKENVAYLHGRRIV